MLFEHLDRLSTQDLLLLDRSYPCRCLPALLNKRGISFCVRVEKAGNGGFACVRDFLRSGPTEQVVHLRVPDYLDAVDYECDSQPTTVRPVRHVASTGKIRVLMTNRFDAVCFPAAIIGDLYHQRWRIEETVKRLKHRFALEHVTGLSQLAVARHLAVKILCDNIHSLLSQAAHDAAQLPSESHINRTFAVTAMRPLLPRLLGRATARELADALGLLARRTYRASHSQNAASTNATQAAQIHGDENMLTSRSLKLDGLVWRTQCVLIRPYIETICHLSHFDIQKFLHPRSGLGMHE
ncbi:transposase [Burkholderia sp. SCN-KJ]|uniref:transposase n=1 Tax=Burkholderia sp. SCN-KJ TaxID=2969248 RepID=UPI00214F90F8|nr:transposase [Burkholderia sp. SCN-KJ]MCR4465342.1 transposase [Burkholderia sp. SCN-KJ]